MHGNTPCYSQMGFFLLINILECYCCGYIAISIILNHYNSCQIFRIYLTGAEQYLVVLFLVIAI